MPGIYEVQIGQRFSFEVYPTSILGNQFQDVRLEGILSARSAASYGVDIEALHANVYPTLPQGSTPNDPFVYGYIRIQYPSGEFAVLGIPWIRQDTIQIATGGRITLTFEDKTQADLDRMLLSLSSNGYRPDGINVNP